MVNAGSGEIRMKLAGLYLAAGRSVRMGRRKLDEPWTGGRRLGGAGLQALMASGLQEVCVVVRPDDPLVWLPAEWEDSVRATESSSHKLVRCAAADRGMSESIKCGWAALQAGEPDAVLIVLADQPFVTVEWLQKLVRQYVETPGHDYVASGNGDRIMPPVILSQRMGKDAMERLQGDRGAGGLIASGEYGGMVLTTANPDRLLFDVDTEADLAEARRMAGVSLH
jgi:molybdenum cofactor cytidylyltransferase